MADYKSSFASFSVSDLSKAEDFYANKLSLSVDRDEQMGLLTVHLPGGGKVMLYPKSDHTPATYTVLNLVVEDIDSAVDELIKKGVIFERFDGFDQDEKGIARPQNPQQGPPIAWFRDPAGNICAVFQD